MDSITENVPETIRIEAKARALKIIEANPGCASYVRPEDLETASIFIPVVSVVKPTKDDFYDQIPGVGIMAKPQLVNLLREKAGVTVTRTDTQKRGEYVWVAHCWGEKRQGDGSMLQQDASYEFDAEKRAELDAINQPTKYGTEIAKRKHLLELAKFGEQRAVTGAQHGLIHKLAHVARSFKTPEELMRGMIVCRIDRNVNGVLADPGMRQAALGQFLGAKENVFGPQTPPLAIEMKADAPVDVPARRFDRETGEEITEPAPATAEEGQTDLFEDDPLPEPAPKAKPPAPDPVKVAKDRLRAYLRRPLPTKGIEAVNATLDNASATVADIEAIIGRCDRTLAKHMEKAGAA
jgi:hypothetical protein